MTIQLRWTVSHSASCFHAARAIVRQLPLADATLAVALAEPARRLAQELAAAGLPAARFWQHLTAHSCQIGSNRELAQLALRKTAGHRAATPDRVAALAGRIADVEAAVRLAAPQLLEQLRHRGGPLREQWEARGPGLLGQLARLTDERLLVAAADVVLLHPALGGGGAAHPLTNTVTIEAVLTNNVPELPEVLRLAWLLAQLNAELPVFSERVPPLRLARLAQLSVLPAVLQAAEQVELAGLNRRTLLRACQVWHLEQPAESELPEILLAWWETYCATRPAWALGLEALDRMVDPPRA